MNILMCALLTTYVLFTGSNLPGNEGSPPRSLTPSGWFVSFIDSFFIGMFIGDWIPALNWGNKLADALKLKGGFLRHIVSVAVLAVVMITCVSFLACYISNIQTLGWEGFMGT